MNCPIHNEEIRVERDNQGLKTSGFCLKCLKHYQRCNKVHYMNTCDLLMNHNGDHIASNGERWPKV